MNSAPAFQFYPKDFLEGSASMNNAETGAYIKLLCHQWLRDSLEDNFDILIRLCNGDEQGLKTALLKFKKDKKGNLKNNRLEIVKKNQKKYEKNKKKSGEKGAKGRWSNKIKTNNLDSIPIVLPSENSIANDSSASASASSTANKYSSSYVEKIFEVMRRAATKDYSDKLIRKTATTMAMKYTEKEVKSIGKLAATFLKDIEPDCLPKKMVF